METARDLEGSGSLEEAFSAYCSVLESFPSILFALLGAGRTAYRLGQSADALEHYRRAAELHPDRPEPILYIAQQQAKDDLVEAAKTYSAGASRFPDNELLRSLSAEASVHLHGENGLSAHFDIDAELLRSEYQERVFLSILSSRRAITRSPPFPP